MRGVGKFEIYDTKMWQNCMWGRSEINFCKNVLLKYHKINKIKPHPLTI